MFALARFELEPLQIIDVAVRREKSAHGTVGTAIRVVVDADPDRGLTRYRKLPHESCALARQRGFDVSLVELIDVVAPDVEDGLADDVLLGFRHAVEKRRV